MSLAPSKPICELPAVIISGALHDCDHRICSLLVKELGTAANLVILE